MIKFNIVVCCYDKILVHVAAYVFPGYPLPDPVYSAPRTHTHTHLTRNYICSHMYQYFIIPTHYYIVFCHFNNS